eukprot:1424688-Rhodomonas_salina.3
MAYQNVGFGGGKDEGASSAEGGSNQQFPPSNAAADTASRPQSGLPQRTLTSSPSQAKTISRWSPQVVDAHAP